MRVCVRVCVCVCVVCASAVCDIFFEQKTYTYNAGDFVYADLNSHFPLPSVDPQKQVCVYACGCVWVVYLCVCVCVCTCICGVL